MNKTITDKDKKLLELLNAHPLLRCRVEALMSIVEESDETIEKADAADNASLKKSEKLVMQPFPSGLTAKTSAMKLS